VEDEKILSSIEIGGFDFRANGMHTAMTISAVLRPNVDPRVAERRVREEIARVADDTPSDSMIERAKGELAREFLADTRGDGVRGLAFNLGYFAWTDHQTEGINNWLDAVDGVTGRDLSDMVRRYLLRAPQVVVTTLPGGPSGQVRGNGGVR
jgi:predicted Zn-dependent peptidase